MGCCQSSTETELGGGSIHGLRGSQRRSVAPELAEYRAMQFRDLTPEDLQRLSQLGETETKQKEVEATQENRKRFIELLPRAAARSVGATECPICLHEFEPDSHVAALQCQHAFCPDCIADWLALHKSECPCCRVPVDLEESASTRASSDEEASQGELSAGESRSHRTSLSSTRHRTISA